MDMHEVLIIVECLSVRQLHCNPASHLVLRLYVYICMSVMLRNANFLYLACAESTAHAHGRTIVQFVGMPQGTSTQSMMDRSA